jgi:hypothetical protein
MTFRALAIVVEMVVTLMTLMAIDLAFMVAFRALMMKFVMTFRTAVMVFMLTIAI